MANQQGDLVIRDGDIVIRAGVAEMDGGLITSAYLSLFTRGGTWFTQFSGAFLDAVQNSPITSASRLVIQRAAERDLAWLVADRVAESVDVEVQLAGRNRIDVTVTIDGTTAGPWSVVWETTQ